MSNEGHRVTIYEKDQCLWITLLSKTPEVWGVLGSILVGMISIVSDWGVLASVLGVGDLLIVSSESPRHIFCERKERFIQERNSVTFITEEVECLQVTQDMLACGKDSVEERAWTRTQSLCPLPLNVDTHTQKTKHTHTYTETAHTWTHRCTQTHTSHTHYTQA